MDILRIYRYMYIFSGFESDNGKSSILLTSVSVFKWSVYKNVMLTKIIPASRIRTSDLRMAINSDIYSPPLYQLSYHGIYIFSNTDIS